MYNIGDVKDKNIQLEGQGYRVRVHWFGELRPQVLGLHDTLYKAQCELLEYPRDCYEGAEWMAVLRIDCPKQEVLRLVE